MALKSTALRSRRGLVGSVVGAVCLSVIGIGGMASSVQAAGGHNVIVKIDNYEQRNLHSLRVLRNGEWSACNPYTGEPAQTQVLAVSGETIGVYAYTDDSCQTFRGDGTDYNFFEVPSGDDGDWTVTL
jgi:hypothetical protein